MPLFTPPHLLDGHRWRNMRVGLLGGSFNPAHTGHIHVSDVAIRRLGLDCVWWLVTPQNPLKDPAGTAPYESRLDQCSDLVRHHPRIIVSDLEGQLGANRTFYTLLGLKTHFPLTDFVFLLGTDLVGQFPQWNHWRDIPRLCALAIVARPPAVEIIRKSGLRGGLKQNRIPVFSGTRPDLKPLNIFEILTGPMKNISSTQIRNSMKTNR